MPCYMTTHEKEKRERQGKYEIDKTMLASLKRTTTIKVLRPRANPGGQTSNRSLAIK